MPEWNGEDRRVAASKDHDLLTTINTNVTILIDQFKAHAKDDKDSFEKHDARISRLEKFGSMAVGGLGLLQYVFTHIWK